MEQKRIYNIVLVTLGFAAFGCLVFMGVKLMNQSKEIYDYSVQLTERAAGKQGATMIQPGYSIIKEGYAQALLFFMLALGILLLIFLFPRLQNISIGPGGITLALKDVQQNIEAIIKQNNIAQANSTGTGGGKGKSSSQVKNISGEVETNVVDDPQKNKWGAKPERNHRKLSAEVNETTFKGFYQVILTVESTSKKFPLTGVVTFHLHNTFSNQDPVIAVQDGKAVLKLSMVYGAFTVGAEADDGDTTLELDLSKNPDFPKLFRER